MNKRYCIILLLLALNTLNAVKVQAQNKLLLAEQYYSRGEYQKALSYLENKSQFKSSNKAYKIIFNSYLALEDYKEVENFVEHAIRDYRVTRPDYYADLVYVYLLQNEVEAADKTVENAKKIVSKNPVMAYNFANSFQKRGYTRIALEMYELAESRMPDLNYDYQKALLYGEIGDIRNMYATYVKMVERSPNYLNTVEQLLSRALCEEVTLGNSDYLKRLIIEKIQLGGPQTLNELLVFIYIQEKNFKGAFTQLKALDKRNPTNKSEISRLGKMAMNNEKFELAQRIFDYIIEAKPNNSYYEGALIEKLRSQKLKLKTEDSDNKNAWRKLQKNYLALKKQLNGMPELGQLNIELAHLTAFRLDDTDSAISILKNTIETGFISEKDRARAKIELGDILLYEGNRWDAILYYAQAEKAFEQSPIGQEAKFKRAKSAYYIGDFQWAQGVFNVLKASTSKLIANDAMQYSLLINDNIALDTTADAMILYAKADLLNYQDKSDSSLQILTTLQQRFPGHSIQDEVLLLRSEILIKNKRYKEAALELKNIIDNFGNGILADNALYRLAQLYGNQINKKEEAKGLYQKLFTEHPDSFFASDSRKNFRELRGDILN